MKIVFIKKFLILNLFIFVIFGCSPVSDNSKKLTHEGQLLKQPDGLYIVKAPESRLQAKFNGVGPGSLVLDFTGIGAYYGGVYYIIPYPVSNYTGYDAPLDSIISSTILGKLKNSFPDKFEILKKEQTEWRYLPALYYEWFVGGEFIKLSEYGKQVVRSNFCYVGIFLKKETHYFWIIYSEPVDDELVNSRRVKSQLEGKERLFKFLEGIELLSAP